MKYKIRLTIAGIIFLSAILGICGILYPVKVFDIQLIPLLQRIFIDFSITAALLLAGVIVLTLIFGRFYCSTICPFGILQEAAALMFKKQNKNCSVQNYPVKYFISAAVFGFLAGGSAFLIRFIEPYTLFGSALTVSILGIIVVLAVLGIVFFKNRFFCTNICPAGTLLGLLSKFSVNKIYIEQKDCVSCGMCERSCPSGCINSKDKTVDNETCIKCLKCLDTCRKNAIKFGRQISSEVTFNPKRREVIIGAAALTLFGAMIQAGISLKDKIVDKLKDFILPPGAGSKERFVNRCFNCNLCVKNCPNNILVKADKEFPVVHIDYTKGFCKYDCNKCGAVCPTGAIKRLSLEEKQNTRIGMAMINETDCTKCGLCAEACPCNAITKTEGNIPVFNALKCIGCGACKHVCPSNAIEVFPIKEQKLL